MAGHIADSARTDWNTPTEILEAVRAVFGVRGIGLDPCSNANSLVNAKVQYVLPTHDGLVLPWVQEGVDTAFVNCPYGSYYMHMETKEIVSQKELKKRCEGMDKTVAASYRGQFQRFGMKDWAKKLVEEHQKGLEIIAFIPCQPGTKAWQKFFHKHKAAVCNVSGRTKFVGAVAGAPMDCVAVYFGDAIITFSNAFSHLGHVDIFA